MRRIELFFPLSHGIVFVLRNGLQIGYVEQIVVTANPHMSVSYLLSMIFLNWAIRGAGVANASDDIF